MLGIGGEMEGVYHVFEIGGHFAGRSGVIIVWFHDV